MKEIEIMLEELKAKLDENMSMPAFEDYTDREGDPLRYSFTFNPPATEEEINQLEADLGITIPNDYREFLTLHNGMILYSSYLLKLRYLSIEEIRKEYEQIQEFRVREMDMEKNKDYPIAELPDVGYLMMISSRIKSGSSDGALIVGEIQPEETYMDFNTFVNNMINTPFDYFWE